ncbi:Carbohydrate family 9 binding domain-like [Fodinibius salinus]|uniref:Carbohydrate family 9 binding domain-like n=1 Tax=Fodinibius salinus TaxID=860790 RepID=A0A5D3YKJ0_9BACT|nr:carbohydrate binding family 9 domain-containing protein [Fodinibius salinus]TYP93476.1 Carbohydrate family 9 binding domain-like [Fodinibius salinus]
MDQKKVSSLILRLRFQYHFIFLIAVLLVGVLPDSYAQSPSDSVSKVHPYQIDEDFEVTADLDHTAWEQASSVFIKHQMQPNDEEEAPVTTEVKVLYSKTHLYVGFSSQDVSPGRIRANVTDRDDFSGDDYVGVFLDPYNNNQNAYEFFVNPLGIQMDAIRTGNSEDMNFDALWYSKATITENGYTAVMKIPFKSINFPDRNLQDWSIQFFRNYPRNNRYQLLWTDVSIDNSCLLCQNGRLVNMQDVESSNTVELLPYAVATQSGALNDPSDPNSGFDNGPVQPKVGGSISYSPTSTSSLDLVINPDFSQVETDAGQISVNETFALFYPEKRPFFVRGSDLFSTSEDLYYSRTINNPLAAGKYTQKGDDFSIAFLSAYDRNTPFIIPGKERSSQVRSDQGAYSNILRAKYNVGQESHIGGLVTTRNQIDGANYVGSLDWDFLLTDNYYFRGQTAYSSTQELNDTTVHNDQRTFGETSFDAAFNGEQYSGLLVNTEFAREAKYYNFSLGYRSYSPTFQSQTGFVNETNRRIFEGNQSISYYPNNDFLSQGSLSMSGAWRYDFSGKFQERYIFLRLSNTFDGQNSLNISYLPLNDERFRGQMFRKINRLTISFNSNTWNVFSFGGRFEVGRDINRTTNPELGKGYSISGNVTIKPTSRFRLTMDYNYSTLSDLDGPQTFYSGNIYRLNSRYHFTSKLYTRLISEYNSFRDELQIYPLVSYKANPFTKFHIGVTSYITEFNQSGAGGFRGYKETSRQFFVKFQYLIRS